MIIRKAVLIIHGFAGGVYDEERLQYHLNSELELDVYNFTLPGHKRNLTHDISYREWLDSAEKHVEMLIQKGYRTIYVVGHSMGGILATHVAIKYKEVKKLVLAAPAFQYLDEDTELKDKVDALVKNGINIVKTYHAKEILSRMLKVSIPMLMEFNKIVEYSQDKPSKVTVPTLIFQGTNDEIVPQTSSEFVYNNVKGKKWLVYLEGITHDIFCSRKTDVVNREIEKFFLSPIYHEKPIRKW